ncbi:hypothetical protein NBRC116583_26160 [Arenicella sp. 4NH20-0111]|uniref:type II secretion system minor pseudopilin GspJ n=1 Tax=Arenicella sp. 4NH20-0111 TaxID=3127648 RepID=UPI00310689C5
MRKFIKHGREGFTLIEIMVAIAIFALIAAIAFPALIQFLDIRERIIQKNDSISSLQKTFTFFSRDVSFAVNRLGKNEFGEAADATMLVGDDSLMELTTSYQDFNLDGSGVPRKVKWLLEDDELYRVQYPVMDPDGDTRVYRQRLLSDVKDVELKVYSIEEGRDSESKRWDEETRLPNMVRLTIEMESGVEYERAFTMLGGDREEAAKAGASSVAAPPNGESGSGDSPSRDENPGSSPPETQTTSSPPPPPPPSIEIPGDEDGR